MMMVGHKLKVMLFVVILFCAGKVYCYEDFIDFNVHPRYHKIELRLLDKTGQPLGSFANLKRELDGEEKELVFAMNAGIFMQNQMPLGLYIENGKTYRKINTRKHLYGNFYLQPNGIFLISNGKPHIIETSKYKTFANNHKIEFATQSGPLLLIAGKENQTLSKYGNHQTIRNAVCIDSQSKVTLSISKQPVSFGEMISHFKKNTNCYSALYLDGAISDAYSEENSIKDSYTSYGPLLAISKKK